MKLLEYIGSDDATKFASWQHSAMVRVASFVVLCFDL